MSMMGSLFLTGLMVLLKVNEAEQNAFPNNMSKTFLLHADAACCSLLSAIGFQTNLPVVIVNTKGAAVTRNATNSQICTCSQGLEKGDVNTTVGFRIRGGTNSRGTPIMHHCRIAKWCLKRSVVSASHFLN